MGSQHSTVGRAKSLDLPSSSNTEQGGTVSEPSTSLEDPILRAKPPLQDPSAGSSSSIPVPKSRIQRDQRSKSTLVIVNRSSPPLAPRLEDDPLFKKLQELPAFLPLMYDVENSSNFWGKSKALAVIENKLDSTSFINIVRLYEENLKRHARPVVIEQRRLAKSLQKVDEETNELFKSFTYRQKKFAKCVENLKKLNDMTHSLSKCQIVIYECNQKLQILNDMLPPEERLETFIWSDEAR